MQFRTWLESEDLIRNMRPETVLPVFHGTTLQDAFNFCTMGIDGKKPQYRLYPHMSGGKPLKFGLFVAPDVKTALKFGSYAVEFNAHGKDLISRFPTEMHRWNRDKHYQNKFPGSFRPIVSDEMLNMSVEPQALFVGTASPDQILAVHVMRNQSFNSVDRMSREQFLEFARKNKARENYAVFHAGEYKMSLQDFVKKLAAYHEATEQEIMDTLIRVYKRRGRLEGIGEVPFSLLRRIERQLASYLATQERPSSGSPSGSPSIPEQPA